MSQSIKRSSIGSIGTVVTSDEVRLSQSVGQSTVHETINNETIMLRQGFQQPNSDGYAYNSTSINVSVFPNPNEGKFTVSIRSAREENFTFRLVSISGQLIQSGLIEQSVTQLNVIEKVNSGTYILQVYSEDGSSSHHKLVIL